MKSNKEIQSEYYAAHREEILEKKKQQRLVDPEKYRLRNRKNYAKDIEASRDYHRKWRVANPDSDRSNRIALKLKVLSYYSKDDSLKCQHPGCNIEDIDMLSLDHIKGGGGKHRKAIGGGGRATYLWIVKNSFPDGFQTLCYNHQWKREIERLRKIYEEKVLQTK